MYLDIHNMVGVMTEICVACNGSGEGFFDGSTCSICGGWGEVVIDLEEGEEI